MNTYPYSNGVIRAIESKILDKSKFQKLAKVEKQSFYKTLIELGYGKVEQSNNVEELIQHELAEVKYFIDSMTPEKKYTDLFFFINDAINIKFLYKQKVFGITHLDVYVKTGTITKEDLIKAIFDEDYSVLTKDQKQLFKTMKERLVKIENPRLLSSIIDQEIFNYIFDRLTIFSNKALTTYFETFIDFQNIITFLRSRILKWDINHFNEMFIDHGIIPITCFQGVYDLSSEQVVKNFQDDYNGQVAKILKAYFDQQDLNKTELAFDGLLMKIMKEFRFDSFNIGPMIYYYLQKVTEAKLIRILYLQTKVDESLYLDF